jgi:Phage integrase, N-terminal SAM-like domain
MTDEAMSPLRRRMIEDMTIRKFAPKTQHDYVQRIKNFTAFLGRSPDTASFEDVRRYQLHLALVWRPATRPFQHCGSFSGSHSNDTTSSSTRRSSVSRASCRWC